MFKRLKRKKPPTQQKLTREEIKRLADHALDVCEPEDLRGLAKAALDKMAHNG